MLTLPESYSTLIAPFAPYFSKRIWKHTLVLLIGAILAPHQRTVTACLRVVGRHRDKHFQNYHRVLNRAVWPSRALSRTLLLVLIQAFAVLGDVIIGIDDTIERRWGAKIKGPRHLSRSGPFQPQSFRQSEWLALAGGDDARAHSVGPARLGVALPERLGPLGALLRQPGTGT